MIRILKVALPVTALALALARDARAADSKAVVAEIEAHDKAFLSAYENGETKKMKSEIGKAISLGEKNGLGADAVMADTYVLSAILEVDGNEDSKAGVRAFVKALKIRPDVAIPKGMATSPVKAALKQAKIEAGLLTKDGAPAPAPAAPVPAAAPTEKTAQKDADSKAAEKQKADEAAAKARSEAQAKQEQEKRDKQAREDQEKRDKQAREDQERQQRELAQKERAAKAEGDKQLGDAKARIQQLEKDKADRDRMLAEKDRQLADARARIQQLEKDKADGDRQRTDKDKQLADLRAQSSKDREALDKIAHDKQVAETQARDAENKKKQERLERERLFAGPEMPARLRESLTCAVPDEAPLRTDLFVHCVARPNVKARTIIFYYRAGSAHYFSVPMERTAKGWYAAIVPGVRVVGKVLQYYAEALDGREAVVANNGKENSPNILSLRPGGPRS
jgi:hypothetical protein